MAEAPPDKNITIHCPRLGHQIYFTYCCQENWGRPCLRTLDCWYPYFDVVSYLRGIMSAEDWEEIFLKPGRSKIVSLVELIENARKSVKKGE